MAVGPVGGIIKGHTLALPFNRTGLNMLPDEDHIKAMFMPRGSRVIGGSPMATRMLRTSGKGEICIISLIEKECMDSVWKSSLVTGKRP
jgi:hypothetical protein